MTVQGPRSQPPAGPAAYPLTDVGSLAADLAAGEPPVLLDVRWRLGGPPGMDSYRAGHLPGAVFVDLDTDLAAPPGAGGRHPLPPAAGFEAAMRRAGVRAGHPVVAYDDRDSTIAARAWWMLRYFGHSRVQVLDGGFRAWAAAGEPVTTDEPAVAAGDFTAIPGHLPVLDAAGAAAVARSGVLLDARAGERYRGETEPIDPVAGHIPGALSAPTSANVGRDGRFRSPADLRRRFAALGVTPGSPPRPAAHVTTGSPPRPAAHVTTGSPPRPAAHVTTGSPPTPAPDVTTGAYCGSGVTAAHEVLALALAGIPAALYVGSWSGWITDPARPVATGPDPG
jgi:thiosulfate/3-mercaptopyruvate sulfurtransferase